MAWTDDDVIPLQSRIERSTHAITPDLWVLNPKALPKFVENQQEPLAEPDRHLVAYHLARFVRAS
jgi:hypothetical protein